MTQCMLSNLAQTALKGKKNRRTVEHEVTDHVVRCKMKRHTVGTPPPQPNARKAQTRNTVFRVAQPAARMPPNASFNVLCVSTRAKGRASVHNATSAPTDPSPFAPFRMETAQRAKFRPQRHSPPPSALPRPVLSSRDSIKVSPSGALSIKKRLRKWDASASVALKERTAFQTFPETVPAPAPEAPTWYFPKIEHPLCRSQMGCGTTPTQSPAAPIVADQPRRLLHTVEGVNVSAALAHVVQAPLVAQPPVPPVCTTSDEESCEEVAHIPEASPIASPQPPKQMKQSGRVYPQRRECQRMDVPAVENPVKRCSVRAKGREKEMNNRLSEATLSLPPPPGFGRPVRLDFLAHAGRTIENWARSKSHPHVPPHTPRHEEGEHKPRRQSHASRRARRRSTLVDKHPRPPTELPEKEEETNSEPNSVDEGDDDLILSFRLRKVYLRLHPLSEIRVAHVVPEELLHAHREIHGYGVVRVRHDVLPQPALPRPVMIGLKLPEVKPRSFDEAISEVSTPSSGSFVDTEVEVSDSEWVETRVDVAEKRDPYALPVPHTGTHTLTVKKLRPLDEASLLQNELKGCRRMSENTVKRVNDLLTMQRSAEQEMRARMAQRRTELGEME